MGGGPGLSSSNSCNEELPQACLYIILACVRECVFRYYFDPSPMSHSQCCRIASTDNFKFFKNSTSFFVKGALTSIALCSRRCLIFHFIIVKSCQCHNPDTPWQAFNNCLSCTLLRHTTSLRVTSAAHFPHPSPIWLSNRINPLHG